VTSVKPSCCNPSQDPFAESDPNHPKLPYLRAILD
jgi:hypothetical protein